MLIPSLLLAVALATGGCERLSDAAFGSKVRAYLLEHPEVIEEAAIALEQKKFAEAQQASKVLVSRHREAIERDRRDYVANPNGKITVTEFFDYHCGYCRQAVPEVMRLIAENPDVRFVFKEYPILSSDSRDLAAAALAAHKQGRYLNLYQAFYGPGRLTPEAADQAIASAGLNPASIKTAAKDPAITRHLQDNARLARELGIDGTPTFIIGDAVIQGGDFERLKLEIAKARAKA